MNTLDCLGEFCPVPTLRVKSRLVEMKIGESLIVLVDHSCAVQNIQEAFKKNECTFHVEEAANGIWEIRIYKNK